MDTAPSSAFWRRTSLGLVIATFVLAVVAGPVWYAGEVVRDEDRFVAISDKVFAHPEVRGAVAEEVTSFTLEALETDEAVAEFLPGQSRALAVPISRLASRAITDAAFDLLDTDVARRARQSALRELHRQLTTDSDEVIIDLRPVMTRTARELAGPTAGSAVTQLLAKSEDGRFTVAEPDSPASKALAAMRSMGSWGWVAGISTIVALALAVAVAPDRRRALIQGGLALGSGAAVSVLLVAIALQATPLLTDTPLGPGIGQGFAESVAADFGQQQRSGVIGGVLLAALGLLLGERPAAIALRGAPRMLWSRDGRGLLHAVSAAVVDNPPMARLFAWVGPALLLVAWPRPTWRVVIGVVLITAIIHAGLWFLTSVHGWATTRRARHSIPNPSEATSEVADARKLERTNLGLAVVMVFLFWPGWNMTVFTWFFVVLALIQTGFDLGPARRLSRESAATDDSDAHSAVLDVRWRYLAAGAAIIVLVGIGATTLISVDVAEAEAGCNGHVELCDRPIDEIVWAGSHNSMSSSDLGWELAAQTGDMVAQLDHGVRALLIDTHYWNGGGAFEGADDPEAAAIIEAAGDDDRIRPGTWLCHGPCALGATDLVSGFTDIALWLDENRREVLLFIVQDEISTSDTVEAFEASGLIERVHTHRPGTPFPTLDELIEQDRRILVYAENEGTTDSWYQNAWDTAFFDTPFKFSVRSDFSCAIGRGAADNSLFLVNHWLTTGVPLQDTASVINGRATLEARVDQCLEEQGRLPTVIAVDFAESGDLVEYVADLNDSMVPAE